MPLRGNKKPVVYFVVQRFCKEVVYGIRYGHPSIASYLWIVFMCGYKMDFSSCAFMVGSGQ